jgi:hypothetical protein
MYCLDFFLVQGLAEDCFCWVTPCRSLCTEVMDSIFPPCWAFSTRLTVNDCNGCGFGLLFKLQQVVNCWCLLYCLDLGPGLISPPLQGHLHKGLGEEGKHSALQNWWLTWDDVIYLTSIMSNVLSWLFPSARFGIRLLLLSCTLPSPLHRGHGKRISPLPRLVHNAHDELS